MPVVTLSVCHIHRPTFADDYYEAILGVYATYGLSLIHILLDQIIGRKPLREYGMKESETESFAKSVEKSQQRLLNQSYIKFDAAQMAEIYRELY